MARVVAAGAAGVLHGASVGVTEELKHCFMLEVKYYFTPTSKKAYIASVRPETGRRPAGQGLLRNVEMKDDYGMPINPTMYRIHIDLTAELRGYLQRYISNWAGQHWESEVPEDEELTDFLQIVVAIGLIRLETIVAHDAPGPALGPSPVNPSA